MVHTVLVLRAGTYLSFQYCYPKVRIDALSDDFLLWKISDHDSEYIGKQRKAPALLSLANKNSDLYPSYPFLVFGSGYNHSTDNACLVVVDMLGKRYSECGSNAKYRPCIGNEIDIPAEDPWKDLYGDGSTSRRRSYLQFLTTPLLHWTSMQKQLRHSTIRLCTSVTCMVMFGKWI